MKSRITATMLTLVLGAVLALAPAAQGSDEIQKEYDARPGQTIELNMPHGGSLEVEGWDRNAVRITCTAGYNDIEDFDIEITEVSGGLRVDVDIPDRSLDRNQFEVHLMVPEEFNVESHSGGGSVEITGVEGTFTGRSAGGGIVLTSVKGEARLTTGGGYIEVVDCELDGRVKSGGGGGIVRNVTGDVDVSSGGGAITYENVRGRDGERRGPAGMSMRDVPEGAIVKKTAGGALRVQDAPDGAFLHTGGGDIKVRNASRVVEARTGGGDIDIEIEDGRVKATTGAGDVEVLVHGGFGGEDDEAIEVWTGYGEATIILPADASFEFDLDLAYTKTSSRDFEIISDFDVDIERTKRWESKQGTPRKHIYGTGSVNGGGPKIIVHCMNADLRIEKR